MARHFKALPMNAMSQGAKIDRRQSARSQQVTMQDPALSVMTDLTQVMPFCTEPTASILMANDRMIACGVRLLFVTDQDGNLLGLITANDILGEKPVQYIKEHGGSREDIFVQDIMVKKDQLDVLYRANIEHAMVGDIVETMHTLGRQHALVVDVDDIGLETVCGMFSTTQIGRQLDMNLEPMGRANSFADVEMAVLSK